MLCFTSYIRCCKKKSLWCIFSILQIKRKNKVDYKVWKFGFQFKSVDVFSKIRTSADMHKIFFANFVSIHFFGLISTISVRRDYFNHFWKGRSDHTWIKNVKFYMEMCKLSISLNQTFQPLKIKIRSFFSIYILILLENKHQNRFYYLIGESTVKLVLYRRKCDFLKINW